jgi:hypothetical protein
MSLFVGWIIAAVLGALLAVGATAGVVQVGTKVPPIGPTFVRYGSR